MWILWLTLGIVLIVVLFSFLYSFQLKVPQKASCDAKACGALDPVSEPEYNMKEIIKQSILLEQHLADKRKRCKDCILKHFLHCQGLAEEAVMLAGAKITQYPLMEDSAAFYIEVCQVWLRDTSDENVMLTIEGQLRDWRKRLMVAYILDAEGSKSI